MTQPAVLTIYTDGASRGNPGAAAFAYVIAQDGQPPIEEAGCLGTLTNNQAEYTALIKALEHALDLGPEHRVMLHSDSELMVKQMNGLYRVKNPELIDLYEQARSLVRRFPAGVTIRHVRRAENSRADALGNEALDGLRSPTPRTRASKGTAPPVAPAPRPSLREQAVGCLRRAATAWAAGDSEPAAETVWDNLVEVLKRHGIRVDKADR
jgi:ribonuclease HI